MIRGLAGFRPRLVPTLIALPLILLCLALGSWQLQRLHWKEGLIAQRDAALAAPPAAPPQTLEEARALALHRIVLDGVFLYDREILMHAIGPKGGIGFDVITPLRTPDGRIVFVDRGFVPSELADAARRQQSEPTGTVRVIGRLFLPSPAGLFVPANRPDRNEWFHIDLPMMAKADRLPDPAPFYIKAEASQNAAGWPLARTALPELPNNHLQYAVTWFALAFAGLVIYLVSQREKAHGNAGISRS